VFMDRPGAALEAFEKSLVARSGPSHAMAMASLLASRNYNREALVLADKALVMLQESKARDPLFVQKVDETDIEEFRKTVSADLAAEQAGGTFDAEP